MMAQQGKYFPCKKERLMNRLGTAGRESVIAALGRQRQGESLGLEDQPVWLNRQAPGSGGDCPEN